MVHHIIMWNFADDVKDKKQAGQKLKHDLEALKNTIEEIVTMKVIINPMDTKCNADILLDSTFKTKEDLEKYIVHKDHKKVGEYVRSVVKNRMCMDYEE